MKRNEHDVVQAEPRTGMSFLHTLNVSNQSLPKPFNIDVGRTSTSICERLCNLPKPGRVRVSSSKVGLRKVFVTPSIKSSVMFFDRRGEIIEFNPFSEAISTLEVDLPSHK